MHDRCVIRVVGGVQHLSMATFTLQVSDAIMIMLSSSFHSFPGHVQQEIGRENALSFNSKLLQDGK